MDEREAIIRDGIKAGLPLKEIGRKCGNVSKQRIYQLMDRYGIETPERKKKNYWKNKSKEEKWLNRTVLSKGVDTENRYAILDAFKDKFPTHCPVLGIELVYGNEKIRGDNSASIDRLDSSKGYTPDNVNIISWRSNRIKNDGTIDDLKKIVAWLSKVLP